jgi:CelD/BcsL family acetyltransferase involved in cellulose biosynthesis
VSNDVGHVASRCTHEVPGGASRALSATLAPMSVELELRTVRRLGDLSGAWDALAGAQPLPSPFLRSWWIDRAGSGEPVVLCCFAGDELVGGAAFERDRPGTGPLGIERLRSVGQGVLAPDHVDLIAADPHRPQVLRSVLGWLHRPGSRLLDLDGLAGDGALAAAFSAELIERTGAPHAVLPDDMDRYFAARPGRVRSTVDRTARRLERNGVRHRSVDVADAGRALDVLAELHEGRWAEDSSFLAAWDRFRDAALAGMHAGEVTIDEMVADDGEVIATELDFVVAGRTSFYQAGRSTEREWRGGGSVLRREIIARAIARGHQEYDLLRGDEPYKSDWSEHRREVVRCRVGIGPVGRAIVATIAARRSLQRLSRATSRPGRAPRHEPGG